MERRPRTSTQILAGSYLHFGSRRGAQLFQQRQQVPIDELFHDLLVLNAVDGSAANRGDLAGGRDAQKWAFLGAVSRSSAPPLRRVRRSCRRG
jgi:hypothetical protein